MTTPALGNIAMQALADALTKGPSTPAMPPAQTSAPTQPEPLPQLSINGPINRVMELEGKRYALNFVNALGPSIIREPVRTQAIADLTRYAASKPASLASGIKVIIDVLKGAV